MREAVRVAAAALAGAMGTAMLDGSLTTGETVAALGVALVGAAGVLGWENRAARRGQVR